MHQLKIHLFVSLLHSVAYLSAHTFEKSPVTFAPSFASTRQDQELQMPVIYSP